VLQPQPYVGIDLHRRRSMILHRRAERKTLAVAKVRTTTCSPSRVPSPPPASTPKWSSKRLIWARLEAPCDRAGCETPPVACRSRSLGVHPGFPGDPGPWIPSSLSVWSCAASARSKSWAPVSERAVNPGLVPPRDP